MQNIQICFDVEAGKYDGDERNCKYCCTFDSAAEAAAAYEKVNDYPWATLDVIINVDGVSSTINLIGGSDPLLRLKMDVANLWMKATGNLFVDVAMSSEEQISDIYLVLQGARNRLYNQSREIVSLQKQVLASVEERFLPWEHVKRAFDSNAITWTRAFDMLMSECGMPMEEALQCLAENFDRRPAIVATEV